MTDDDAHDYERGRERHAKEHVVHSTLRSARVFLRGRKGQALKPRMHNMTMWDAPTTKEAMIRNAR